MFSLILHTVVVKGNRAGKQNEHQPVPLMALVETEK